MQIREFFAPSAVKLDLAAATKDDALLEMIGLLGLDERTSGNLFKMLKRRENLGSTGIGRGTAVPHCRLPAAEGLRVAFGRSAAGIPWKAIDDQPVHNIFLIVAPQMEVSNQYLPVLGRIAQLAKEPDMPERLAALTDPAAFFGLLETKGV